MNEVLTYEALKADRDALAVENAALKEFCKNAAFDADYESELGMERGGFTDALNNIETPATDAALAAIEAQGVEKFAAWASDQQSMAAGDGDQKESSIYRQVEARAKHFAIELREGK